MMAVHHFFNEIQTVVSNSLSDKRFQMIYGKSIPIISGKILIVVGPKEN
jgi:hypothetical protein